jgi:hypothetical protein
MHNNADHITIEFHNQAKRALFNLIEEFQFSVKEINRTTNEFLFQESKGKFVNTFKQQLEMIASQIIRDHQAQEKINEINQSLQTLINNYLHQFVQKIKSA